MKSVWLFAQVVAGMPGYGDPAVDPTQDYGGAPSYQPSSPAAAPAGAPAGAPKIPVPPVGGKYDPTYPGTSPVGGDYGAVDPASVSYGGTDPASAGDYGALDPASAGPSYGGDVSPVGGDYAAVDPVSGGPSYGGGAGGAGGAPYYPDAGGAGGAPLYPDLSGIPTDYPFDDEDFLDGWDYPYPTPGMPTPIYDPCLHYDVTDYDTCISPVDVDDVPVCTYETEVDYVTVTKGTPVCETVYETQTIEEYCPDVATTCVYETSTVYDACDPQTIIVTEPSKYETVCIGTKTIAPATYTDVHFTYEPIYIHPVVRTTSTVYASPEPDYKTSYDSITVKLTSTQTKTEYETVTSKTTPVVTNTVYDGCVTVSVYHTYTPPPVVDTVTKTIYVPKGCVDPIDACPTGPYADDAGAWGGDYGTDIGGGSADPYYPGSSPVGVPSYGGDADAGGAGGAPYAGSSPVDVPSYGGATDPVTVDKYDYSGAGAAPVSGGDYASTAPVAGGDYTGAVDPASSDPYADIAPSY